MKKELITGTISVQLYDEQKKIFIHSSKWRKYHESWNNWDYVMNQNDMSQISHF